MEEQGRVELEESLDFRALMQGGDVTFSVKDIGDNQEGSYKAPEDVFDPDVLIEYANLKVIDGEGHATDMPFESIKATMTKLNPKGTIMKKVLRQGVGEVMPPDALVRIHYAGFFELNEVPFDSSYFRAKPIEFILGCSNVVPGLDMAVASMRNQEKAEYIIHPSLAYGKCGCPPRILPDAEVLFVIEVMKWSAGSEAAVARATANTKGEKSWEHCKPAFKALNHEAISLFNDSRLQDSKAKLEKAKRLIENCHLKDEEEEKDYKRCLGKVCLNLAMVLNKLQGHASYAPSAIINSREAWNIDRSCGKAQLQWGLALITLGELEKAKDHLLIAKKILPLGSPSLTEAFEKLELKKKKERDGAAKMWKNAFKFADNLDIQEKESSSEVEDVQKLLEDFKMGSEEQLILPARMTAKESEVIKAAAQNLNLEVNIRDKSMCISKN